MILKDIRLFREFYKTSIKRTADTDRNPHFAGEEAQIDSQIQFGFFEMFNGQGSIENKLTTILNIAGDSQAIYEFMQNAVDADSKNFFLAKYGPEESPYLIVLNDGEYFTLQSIVSILSIGASSKYRNPDNIGQFGVGFKLAHRLIGADNSLKELIEENKGPLLFSWANSELTKLADAESFETADPLCVGTGKDAHSESNDPWLFKIVATNFPCFIEDAVWDAKGRPATSLFTQEDLAALKGAAKHCLSQCKEAINFQTGTLLVIPLHPAKVEHVIGKVPKGLEVASTIISRRAKKLNDLRTQIEAEELVPETLYSEHWELSESETLGRLGNETVKVAELMFLYGDPFETNPFKGKPQFYRYFPMSLEQHGFRFAIHGNALTLSSARTELQENDSNKFLFQMLMPLLEEQLKAYVETDPKRFCYLYASILLSYRGEGSNSNWIQGRQWLEAALWNPLLDILKRNVPIKLEDGFKIAEEPNRVLVKNSRLPLENWFLKEHGGWFLWEESEKPLVCFEAYTKLALKAITILDILSNSECIPLINEWLSKSPENASAFLMELNNSNPEGYDKATIWKNFGLLKLWWFDNNVYTIENLSKQENLKFHLISYGPLQDIKERLVKVNILLSEHVLDTYDKIERAIRESTRSLPYLFNYEELNKLLSQRFILNTELNAEDKATIFTSIESAVRSSANTSARRIETMKPLALFSNKRGEVKPLFQLTSFSGLPVMLQDWHILEGETARINLKEYLSDTREDIYENIIKPLWNDIASQEKQDPDQRRDFFKFVKASYTLKPTMGSLVSEAVFFTESGGRTNGFYHQTLIQLKEEEYVILSKLLSTIGIYLPQSNLLSYYKDAPFMLPSATSIDISRLQASLSAEEVKVLVRWLLKAFPETAQEYLYCEVENDQIRIQKKLAGLHQYLSQQKSVHGYVTTHFSQKLLPLPEALEQLLGNVVLHGEKLFERLIFETQNNSNGLIDMIPLIIQHGNDGLRLKLLGIMPNLNLSDYVEEDSLQHESLKLCFSIQNEAVRKDALGKLAGIFQDGIWIPLYKVQNRGSDTLTITPSQKLKLTFSVNALLGGNANAVNQLLTQFAERSASLGIGTLDQLAIALGIHEQRKPLDVWDQLIEIIKDGRLLNGDHLTFTWALGKSKELLQLQPKVETLAGWQALSGAFYLKNAPFIPAQKVLSSNYGSIADKVDLSAGQIEGINWNIQAEPNFNINTWVMPDIDHVEKINQPAFWKYLYEKWMEAGYPGKVNLQDATLGWKPLLGLNPSDCILIENYALPEEKVPVLLLTEYGLPIENMYSFLAALGAQGEQSAVIKTRRYFKRDNGSFDTSMSHSQTIATLKWLCSEGVIVQREEITTFYRNLAGKSLDLSYFPAFTPGHEGLKIVSLSEDTYYINKEELQRATHFDLKPHHFAETMQAPIINLANLQDWVSYLSSKAKPLNIKWKELDWEQAQQEGVEWAFPFYQEWKKSYPNFQIIRVAGGEIPRKIVVYGRLIKRYRSGKAIVSQDMNIVYVGGADTDLLLNELENIDAFHLNARTALSQYYNAQSEQFEQFIELAKNDSGFAKLLKEHAEAIKLQEERTERAEVVKNANNKYTVNWFLNLLELVRVQEKSASIPEVIFSKIERIPAAHKTFELSESSGRIPVNIESFDEIPATIVYLNNHNEPTIAQTRLVASEKHQKLWVMFPEATIQPLLEDTKRILQIKLEFTRTIDLIEELKNGFRRLNLPEDANLKESLSPNIDFIFGPPGTGKTTELANRILKKDFSKAKGPVVILTPTNKAADVLAKKIISLNDNVAPAWLVRAGSCTDPLLLEENVVKSGNELLIEPQAKTVLITTIHRFPYFMVPINQSNSEKSRLCDCPWAEVIFDEASMIPVAYIVHAIQVRQRANAVTKFLIAGDPLQIPPVLDLASEDLEELAEELQQENVYNMIGLKSFDPAIQQTIPIYGSRIYNLNIQHRSVPAIGELFSKFQYGARITHSRGTDANPKPRHSRALPEKFAALGFKPITVIRYPVRSGDSIFKPQKLEGSPLHLYSSLLISELIKFFRSDVSEKNMDKWSVGVLALYRSQADVLLKMIEAHTHQNPDVTITTDTVHGFQGDENNIVFALFNPSGTGENISYSRFLQKEFILNVAISRAEDYLIMLIPDNNSKGFNKLPLINQLLQLANETDRELLSVIDSADLEEKLMGQRSFFELKSFSSSHQKVNVYGKPDLPYMIRLNDKSLDVHWEG